MSDPADENKIPQCTLKMFPEEPLHCIEWAKDKFETTFFHQIIGLEKILT